MKRTFGFSLLVAIAAVGFGCPGGGGGGKSTGPTGNGKGTKKGSATVLDAGVPVVEAPPPDAAPAVAKQPGGGVLPADGVDCTDHPCMYHAGADTYHMCLSGAEGNCSHFGATCAPKSKCMYDRRTASHRSCTKIVDGRCAKFAAACAPTGNCMYNRRDNLYHQCASPRAGKCPSFGATCLPK